MKKLIAPLAVGALIAASMSATSFATTNNVRPVAAAEQVADTYTTCPVENCTQTGNHGHDGTTYSGHYNEDGHASHANNEQHNAKGQHNRHNQTGGHHK